MYIKNQKILDTAVAEDSCWNYSDKTTFGIFADEKQGL